MSSLNMCEMPTDYCVVVNKQLKQSSTLNFSVLKGKSSHSDGAKNVQENH